MLLSEDPIHRRAPSGQGRHGERFLPALAGAPGLERLYTRMHPATLSNTTT